MKYFKIIIISFISLFCFNHQAPAKENKTQIIGFIYGPYIIPAIYTTVLLLNKDTVLIRGTFSQKDGSFVFGNIVPGDYFISVRNMEFKTYMSGSISVIQNEQYVYERISLIPVNYGLDEMVSDANKAKSEMDTDTLFYDVSNGVNATGNNWLELLSKLPGVDVDNDNNIFLENKRSVRIFINGRPTYMVGNELTKFLEDMRSDNVQTIEIINYNSLKYDAVVTTGFINIVLR